MEKKIIKYIQIKKGIRYRQNRMMDNSHNFCFIERQSQCDRNGFIVLPADEVVEPESAGG